MEWNVFGLLGYFVMAILFLGTVCILVLFVTSLILRSIYKETSNEQTEGHQIEKKFTRLSLSIALVVLFSILLYHALKNV